MAAGHKLHAHAQLPGNQPVDAHRGGVGPAPLPRGRDAAWTTGAEALLPDIYGIPAWHLRTS
jgi:hypothetical protein